MESCAKSEPVPVAGWPSPGHGPILRVEGGQREEVNYIHRHGLRMDESWFLKEKSRCYYRKKGV